MSKFTIGMATFNDYDGVYFTVQSLRMYHSREMRNAEIIIIDNNPQGPAYKALRTLLDPMPNARYIPYDEVHGTAQPRNQVFIESKSPFTICMDCHVQLVPSALRRLLSYWSKHRESPDLLQGPLLADNYTYVSTHFAPVWRDAMYGVWEHDTRGADVDAEPFEIEMQGLGLFACTTHLWPGFNRRFRSFGGEEGYIHEKIRQAGGRVMCLPFLRWNHRFGRPAGVPYPDLTTDRIRNYLIGWTELGLDIQPILDHFEPRVGAALIRKAQQQALH